MTSTRVEALRRLAVMVPVWALLAAAMVCTLLALPARWDAPGLGGVLATLGGMVISAVARSRDRRDVRASAPSSLTSAQREQAWAASRRGPLPADPDVRRETLRLAEWRGSDVVSSPWRPLLVMGGVVVALAVAGAIWSHWWWGTAGALAVLILMSARNLAGSLDWRSRLRVATRGSAVDPEDLDLHRAGLDEARRLARTTPGYAVLQLSARSPAGGASSGQSLRATIDGRPVTVFWGDNAYVVRAGRHKVSAVMFWTWGAGQASLTVEVLEGESLQVHYSPPAFTFLDGRMALTPQPRAGARALAIIGASFVVLLLVAIIFG